MAFTMTHAHTHVSTILNLCMCSVMCRTRSHVRIYSGMNTLIGLSHTVSTSCYELLTIILCVYQCHAPRGEVGICACGFFYNAPGIGSDWHANPLHIPYLSPTGDHSPNREHFATCPHTYVLLKNTNVSNAPPLWQQTACKSPRIPTLPRVGHDNDWRITCIT